MRHHHFPHSNTAVHPTADGYAPQGQPDHPFRGWKLHGRLFHHPHAPDQTSPKRWQQLHASPLGIGGDEHRRKLLLRSANILTCNIALN
jgi:hypothetical protein